MRWDDFRRSDNVEDDRDAGGGFGGGGVGIPVGGGGLGIGTVIVLGLIGWALGIDPSMLIGGAELVNGGIALPAANRSRARGAPARRTTRPASSSPPCLAIPRTPGRRFSRAAASNIARRGCGCYPAAEQGGCGFAQAAMGPFYCPTDQRIYLDTSFFRDMRDALSRLQRQGLRICRGLCDRARGRPSRAEPARHFAEGAAARSAPPAARRRRTASRCGSSCRPTVLPASGPIIPTSAGIRSSRATSRRRCRRPRRSATTGCSNSRAATWCPTPSPTAPRRSGSAGSPPA